MVALVDGGVESIVTSILHLLHQSGGQLNRRKAHPGADQLTGFGGAGLASYCLNLKRMEAGNVLPLQVRECQATE